MRCIVRRSSLPLGGKASWTSTNIHQHELRHIKWYVNRLPFIFDLLINSKSFFIDVAELVKFQSMSLYFWGVFVLMCGAFCIDLEWKNRFKSIKRAWDVTTHFMIHIEELAYRVNACITTWIHHKKFTEILESLIK